MGRLREKAGRGKAGYCLFQGPLNRDSDGKRSSDKDRLHHERACGKLVRKEGLQWEKQDGGSEEAEIRGSRQEAKRQPKDEPAMEGGRMLLAIRHSKQRSFGPIH